MTLFSKFRRIMKVELLHLHMQGIVTCAQPHRFTASHILEEDKIGGGVVAQVNLSSPTCDSMSHAGGSSTLPRRFAT